VVPLQGITNPLPLGQKPETRQIIHNGVLEDLSKDDLVLIVRDQQQRIDFLEMEVAELKKEVA
jgi:hypothetical protein